jgi:hypothetical protein
LEIEEVRRLIADSGAHLRLTILDACRVAVVSLEKGGTPRRDFEPVVDRGERIERRDKPAESRE